MSLNLSHFAPCSAASTPSRSPLPSFTASLTAPCAFAMPPKDAYKYKDDDIDVYWKFDDMKRLRHLLKKARMIVNIRGPISARYTPIMKYMMEVSLFSLQQHPKHLCPC